jgi:hypothetical protein
VPNTLPILFFGNPSATVATVGLNPSSYEYTARDGVLLTGKAQRFATLQSLGATSRSALTDRQCQEAIDWMRDYYDPGKPVYSDYFRVLDRVLAGIGVSHADATAVHLDLVQEATQPTWSHLGLPEQEALLGSDLPFLAWELAAFPIDSVVCTTRTASDHVKRLLQVTVRETGNSALLRWWVGDGEVAGRRIRVAGWNRALQRPTGLDARGLFALGATLASRQSR